MKVVNEYFVYILYSEYLDVFYIGSCQNVESRLGKHLSNHNGYTGKAKDWVVKYTERISTKTEALAREKQLKGWKNKNRIKELIVNSYLVRGSDP